MFDNSIRNISDNPLTKGGERGMNKSELVEAMAKAAGVSKAASEKALNGALAAITKALKKGDKVTLVGFGTFSVAKRAARQGRNPQTGKMIKIGAKKVAKFKAGSKLADAVKK
jgi:DNA-binding protein HU-beta